jgi:hypothetical protein
MGLVGVPAVGSGTGHSYAPVGGGDVTPEALEAGDGLEGLGSQANVVVEESPEVAVAETDVVGDRSNGEQGLVEEYQRAKHGRIGPTRDGEPLVDSGGQQMAALAWCRLGEHCFEGADSGRTPDAVEVGHLGQRSDRDAQDGSAPTWS